MRRADDQPQLQGLICLISSTGSLGTAGQINYSSTKAAMSVMPKVITAEFFRRNMADKIRCVAVAPGYVGTAMVKGMNSRPGKIIENVPSAAWWNLRRWQPDRGIVPQRILAGDVFFIHGGLRLGSKG